jgi:endonuclease YncB( thermonuclease family)
MNRTVKEIIDGDTFTTTLSEYVRIANINTPEKGSSGYTRAKSDLRSIIPPGTTVNLSKKATDVYGRIVADVFKDGQNVANLMKNKGW